MKLVCTECGNSEIFRRIYDATVTVTFTPEAEGAWGMGDVNVMDDDPQEQCEECGSDDIEEVFEDAPPTTPTTGDYVIFDSGPLLSRTSLCTYEEHFLGEFSDTEQAVAAIRSYMERDKVYPDVWYLSDHGNWSLILLDEEFEVIQ